MDVVVAGGHGLRRCRSADRGPTITARIRATGRFGELAGRLWDVSPAGTQRLISRGIYRLSNNQTGRIRFQLNGNGYLFAHGDTALSDDQPAQARGSFRPAGQGAARAQSHQRVEAG